MNKYLFTKYFSSSNEFTRCFVLYFCRYNTFTKTDYRSVYYLHCTKSEHKVMTLRMRRDSATKFQDKFLIIQKAFRNDIEALLLDETFADEFEVKDPYKYSFGPYRSYVKKYLTRPVPILFLGVNPGPYGMGKYGIPFGDIYYVVEWLRIKSKVLTVWKEEIDEVWLKELVGERREDSGSRFWGLIEELFDIPENFFGNCFVHNYCPLMFSTKSTKSRNVSLSDNDLRHADRLKLQEVCDEWLYKTIQHLGCRFIVAVGDYASRRAEQVKTGNSLSGLKILKIYHPSLRTRMSEEKWRRDIKKKIRNFFEQHELRNYFPFPNRLWEESY